MAIPQNTQKQHKETQNTTENDNKHSALSFQ
jgi:hypothetical protein